MVLIKNVTTTSKEYLYLKIKNYIIIVKVVDEATQAHILKMHNKLLTTQHALKKVNYFLLIIDFFFKFKD
jgi:hypothetical protein